MSEPFNQPEDHAMAPQRNAALQTARSILVLERRAETERLEAKKRLEDRTVQAEARFEQAEMRTGQTQAHSEELLHASELRYRRLFEASKDGILILDVDTGRITDVNPFLIELLGFSHGEMIGKTVGELSPFKDIESNQAILERLQQQGYVRYEDLPLETKDGRHIAVEFVCNVYQASDIKVIQCNVRDLTEAKKIAARFRRLVDSNAQGVIFWNTKGEITGANDAFLRLVRYSREDLESGRMGWMAMTPPEYADNDRRRLEEIAAEGVCAPFEKEFIRKDGSRVPVLMGVAAFEDNPEEGVCYVLDLTERKKLEHQFLRAQRMEGIGTLAGGIAHDLNNILTPIMMSIDILKLTATDPQAKNILATIEVCAKRGADIVRQVLSFARGLEGERVEVHFKELLRDIETILKDTFPKNIRMEISVADGSWMIVGDPTQLQQILLNLCVNARDAMPEGGRLMISVENTVLDEHSAAMHNQAKPGRYVTMSVTDSGTGIPPAILDKIFEPFFTTKEVGKGTGLGLSTVIAIVKGHGGFVNAYSPPGKGTIFKVYLPAIEVSAEQRKDAAGLASLPPGNGETILIVDDEASIRTITSRTLEAFGYRTLTAEDGAEAVAIYAMHRDLISAVLTDMAMPIMDGSATIRALTKINPAIKIVAASGLNENGGMTRVSGSVVKHFLTKPYTATTLIQAMRTILDEEPATPRVS
jgi:PAS domain S-box-containing protein